MKPIIDWIKKFGRWIIRVAKWLWEEKKVWITVLSIIGVFFFFWLIFPEKLEGEDRFRLTGLTLELLGICTVVYGVNETLKSLERPQLHDIISEWFKRFPKFEDKNNDITLTLNGMSSTCAQGSLFPHILRPVPNSLSLDKRVTLLEENLNQTNMAMFVIQQMLKQESQSMSEALTNESREREVGDENAQQQLKEFAVEGLALEIMGVV
ncbi:hypothetical protein [Methylobacter svalbardensis]|uniref:hypothetical protein n=1 Tax=Methylobacter svalbardensis TaxID=3080016 RepID=UPI0030EF28E0